MKEITIKSGTCKDTYYYNEQNQLERMVINGSMLMTSYIGYKDNRISNIFIGNEDLNLHYNQYGDVEKVYVNTDNTGDIIHKIEREYNSKGQLTRSEDGFGNIISSFYDEDKELHYLYKEEESVAIVKIIKDENGNIINGKGKNKNLVISLKNEYKDNVISKSEIYIQSLEFGLELNLVEIEYANGLPISVVRYNEDGDVISELTQAYNVDNVKIGSIFKRGNVIEREYTVSEDGLTTILNTGSIYGDIVTTKYDENHNMISISYKAKKDIGQFGARRHNREFGGYTEDMKNMDLINDYLKINNLFYKYIIGGNIVQEFDIYDLLNIDRLLLI